MALPNVNIAVQDGGLGLVAADATDIAVKLGVCSAGVVNQVYQFSDQTTLQNSLGSGPLADAAALSLATAGGPVWCVPVNPSVAGTVAGSVPAPTHTGTGTSTLTISGQPLKAFSLLLTVTTAVATVSSGTGAITYSLDGGVTTSAPVVIPASGTYVIPNTGLTLQFLITGSFVLADTFSAVVNDTAEKIQGTGASVGTATLTISGQPADEFDILVSVVSGATLVSSGTGVVTYSLDGGNTVSAPLTVPASGIVAIPNTGMTLNFTAGSSLVTGNYFTAFAIAPNFTISDITAAISAVVAEAEDFGFMHLVGQAASTAAAVALFASLDSLMSTLFNEQIYTWICMEAPKDTDAAIIAAWASVAASSRRVMVAAGTAFVVSPLTGLIVEQSDAWEITARAALVIESESLSYVGRGPVQGIPAEIVTGASGLVRDETVTPGLDGIGLATLRTVQGKAGFYIAHGNLKSPTNSDFSVVQYRRVMDLACKIARNALLDYEDFSPLLNPADGTIAETEAQHIESEVHQELVAELVTAQPGQLQGMCTAASIHISRTQNIESTNEMPVEVAIIPLGYTGQINVTLTFVNPALSA